MDYGFWNLEFVGVGLAMPMASALPRLHLFAYAKTTRPIPNSIIQIPKSNLYIP